MSKIKKPVKPSKTSFIAPFSNYWTKANLVLTIISVVALTLGFVLMAQGPWDNPLSLTVSPILLIITYVVIIPVAIMFLGKKKQATDNNSSAE